MKLIVDIGGTRGRWFVLDKKNQISFKSDGFNPFTSKIDVLSGILVSLKSSFDFDSILNIHYYGAGISSENKKSEVRKVLKRFFTKSDVEINSDLLGSCRALCNDKSGVVGILGTGSNSCYYDGNKIKSKIKSLGYLLGDEGSGYDMGKKILIGYLRNDMPTTLKDKFSIKFDKKMDLLERLYDESNKEKFIASFSNFIHENKENGYVREFLQNHFSNYFENIILKYSSKNIYLTGSIAYYFKNEILMVANEKNLIIEKIEKDPINHLCDFHVK